MDIQSMYTCIPHADGQKALCFFLSRRPNQAPSTNTLIHLTELVLTINNFSFNSSHFLQTKGVAMGTRMGLSYAYLFIGYVEQSLFRCYTGTSPHLFLRYIDDCISTALCSHEELERDRALHNSLVRSTLPTSPTTDSTFPCNRRKCYTCLYTLPLTSIQGTKQTVHIRQRFICTSINVVYCICCSRFGLLYIGETKWRLGDRFVEHLHSVHDKRQQLPVGNQFNSLSDSLSDMSILGLL
eukprot:g29354.t1